MFPREKLLAVKWDYMIINEQAFEYQLVQHRIFFMKCKVEVLANPIICF